MAAPLRIWSLHPKYLDSKGLVAQWREALLAQKVLRGETKAYMHHPQLRRFQESSDPTVAIAAYLSEIHLESERRGYRFNKSKILSEKTLTDKLPITDGQLKYEFSLLARRLSIRDRDYYRKLEQIVIIEPNPIFETIEGGIACWEIVH